LKTPGVLSEKKRVSIRIHNLFATIFRNWRNQFQILPHKPGKIISFGPGSLPASPPGIFCGVTYARAVCFRPEQRSVVPSDYPAIGKCGGHMSIEEAGSIILIIVIAFLLRHLHKTGKEIQQQQRDLEEK